MTENPEWVTLIYTFIPYLQFKKNSCTHSYICVGDNISSQVNIVIQVSMEMGTSTFFQTTGMGMNA
jgi:hypothetical protein